MQVVLSIKAGKVCPRRCCASSRITAAKTGCTRRSASWGGWCAPSSCCNTWPTRKLREQIHAATNKVEVYNEFTQWLGFGGDEIPDKDPVEIEKRIKYRDLIANTVILQNTVDLSYALAGVGGRRARSNARTWRRSAPTGPSTSNASAITCWSGMSYRPCWRRNYPSPCSTGANAGTKLRAVVMYYRS